MMNEYKSNEAYEEDKLKAIRLLTSTIDAGGKWFINLLRQSKWVGDEIEVVRPLPVVKDGNGKLIKDYKDEDWLAKLNEELDEVKYEVASRDCGCSHNEKIAEELQDLITVATSMQEYLGYDEANRSYLAKRVNEKNSKRGYHSVDIEELKTETDVFYIPTECTASLNVKDIEHIIEVARNGAVSHWCSSFGIIGNDLSNDVGEHIAHGGSLSLGDIRCNGKWELNRGKLLKGVKMWLDTGHIASTIMPDGRFDWNGIEDYEANYIIQYALFGEIIFD